MQRTANGTIVADPTRFPSGMRALSDYVHSKGLRFGLYTARGSGTCQGRPGSLDHEYIDAATYCDWGECVCACVRLCRLTVPCLLQSIGL